MPYRELGSGGVYTGHDVPVFHFGSPPVVKPKKKKKRKKEKPVEDTHNPVAHPSHYNRGKVEVIDLIEGMDFSRGSIIKYVYRAGHKPGGNERQDLEKALWLLERELEKLGENDDIKYGA